MRGIRSIFFSLPADIDRLKTGLFVRSCSDQHGDEILRRIRLRMPQIPWSVVRRFEPAEPDPAGRVFISSQAVTVPKKVSLIRNLRKERFDVVVVAWTGEKSFNPLKIAACFSNFRYLLVYNENYGAFFAVKKNRSYLLRHIRWRMRDRGLFTFRKPGFTVLSWIFLYPPGVAFITLRTGFLVLRRLIRKI